MRCKNAGLRDSRDDGSDFEVAHDFEKFVSSGCWNQIITG